MILPLRHDAALLLLLAAAIALSLPAPARAYITGTVPAERQIRWLKEMTSKLCTKTPGQLSPRELAQGHDLMYAWSHLDAGSRETALAVESLLQRVVAERRAGNAEAATTLEDYNCLLEGWARARCGAAAAERCETILHRMQAEGPAPDLSSFKVVLMAWREAARTGCDFAPHRAQRVLEWMVRLAQRGENARALPDSDCFDIVLQTWSRAGHRDAPRSAEKLLGTMERLYKATGLPRLRPRTTSFNAVVAAWCRSGSTHALGRATDILTFMELMEAQGEAGMGPDRATHHIIMGALAGGAGRDKARLANQADVLLQHIEDGYYAGRDHLVPDTWLYNTVMGLWAKANVPRAYRRARSVLDRQRVLHDASGAPASRPDVYGYTSVIASCAAESGHKKDRLRAFDVALTTFEELRAADAEAPNHVTYGAMLKACARLLPSSSPVRRRLSREVFQAACRAGCVGDMTVSRFREAASPECYRELMQGHGRRALPMEWTRNVQEKNAFRVRRSSQKRQSAEV